MKIDIGVQRVLDYCIFKHNFDKFSQYIEKFIKNYEMFKNNRTKFSNKPISQGYGKYIKYKRINQERWYDK